MLNKEMVLRIKLLLAKGVPAAKIAKEFNVCRATVYRIKNENSDEISSIQKSILEQVVSDHAIFQAQSLSNMKAISKRFQDELLKVDLSECTSGQLLKGYTTTLDAIHKEMSKSIYKIRTDDIDNIERFEKEAKKHGIELTDEELLQVPVDSGTACEIDSEELMNEISSPTNPIIPSQIHEDDLDEDEVTCWDHEIPFNDDSELFEDSSMPQ